MSSSFAPERKSRLDAGAKIGRFEIVRELGDGAQGVVYEARGEDGARLALKAIHRHLLGDPQVFKRFHREAAILKRLEGEHLVQFVDFIEDDGLLIIALEYVEGHSLEELIRDERRPIDTKKAVEIALQICAALGLAHAQGVVHRDLKPANVLVEHAFAKQEPLRVRVVDFGLAKVLHGEQMSTGLTEQDMIFGTPEYMAPEQARGDDCDGRADLYATGVMLYEMVVGKVPFQGRTPLATMTAHLTEPPPTPRSSERGRDISPALDAVIQRALAKNAADRYPTGRAFAEALVAARDQTVVIAPRLGAEAEGTSDTDLHVSTTGLAMAKTLPETSPLSVEGIAKTLKSPAVTSSSGPISKPASSRTAPRASRGWLWAVVAVVAAIVGIAVGVVFGAR